MRKWIGWGSVVVVGAALSAASCGGSDDEFKSSGTGGSGAEDAGVAGAAGAAGGSTGGSGGVSAGGAAGMAGAAGAAGLAGAAGMDAGSDAPVCTDDDNDGQTTCDGDCDDTDPQNFTGNKELCGDLADNNCDKQADEVCGGIGTFVSADAANIPNNTYKGTKDEPVLTIGEGIANAQTIMATTGEPVSVFVAQGHYPEKVTLVEGISLLGGFNCTAADCTWARDPSQYDSAINNQDFEGVVAKMSITRKTRLDGFRILGLAGDPTGNVPGTVGISLLGGTPTISNNTVTAGKASGGTGQDGRSVGIAIMAPSNDPAGALIESNTITAGDTLQASVGILMDTKTYPPQGKTYAVIARNTIAGATGKNSQGVALWTSGTGTVLRNNDIRGGTANGGSSWAIIGESIAAIDGNRINTDPNNMPSCTVDDFCGGIFSLSGTLNITNNVIYGGGEVLFSAGVYLTEMERPAGAVVLNSNYIDGAGQPNSGATSRSAAVAFRISLGTNTWVGRIINNIMVGGQASNRFGVFEVGTAGKTIHPEVLLNNSIFIGSPDATKDALYSFYDGQSTVPITDLATLEARTFSPIFGNLDVDCNVDATWHLIAGSPCIDAGIATDAPAADFEGDPRPAGAAHDIGADEAPAAP